MAVKTHQVLYFLALCEEQSFTRAARRCGIAQPSLTRAIQALESEFGGRLFERKRSLVCLTSLGHFLRPDFESIGQATKALTRKVAEIKDNGASQPLIPDQWRDTCV
jgi:LysR family transcriptional regulator, hydrogen peroxide-inducible genes activator